MLIFTFSNFPLYAGELHAKTQAILDSDSKSSNTKV